MTRTKRIVIAAAAISLLLAAALWATGTDTEFIFANQLAANTFTQVNTFLAGISVTGSITRSGVSFVEVCSTCQYTTIAAALAAITDASASNPRTIRIFPGIYNEAALTWKSFVYLVGDSRDSTIIYCTGSCNTINLSTGQDDAGFSNVTIAGQQPVAAITGVAASGALIAFDNVVLGDVTGTYGLASRDCIVEQTSTGGYIWQLNNSVCRTNFDSIRLNSGSQFYSFGTLYETTSVSSGIALPRVFSTNGSGNSFYINDAQVILTDTGTSGDITGLKIEGTTAPSVAETIQMNNVSFIMNISANKTSGTIRCVYLRQSGDASADVPVKINNMTCQITNASSSGALVGIEVAASNHDEWVVDVTGGIVQLAGGSSRTDIVNSETVAGYSLNVCGLKSGGVVTGAGTMTSCRQACAVVADLAAADDNFEFWMPHQAATVISVGCRCKEVDGTTCETLATFTLQDVAGNAMTITGTNPTCATTGLATYATVTSGNTLSAGEGVAFDVTNTPSPSGSDEYMICVSFI